MRKHKSPTQKNFSGFSLVEMMIAVSIMGILAAVAIPNYNKYLRRSKQAEAKVNLSSAYMAESTVRQDQRSYTACLGEISAVPVSGVINYSIGISNGRANNMFCGPYGNYPTQTNNRADTTATPNARNCRIFSWVASGTVPATPYQAKGGVASQCALADAFATGAGTFYQPRFFTPRPAASPACNAYTNCNPSGGGTGELSFDNAGAVEVQSLVSADQFRIIASGHLGGEQFDMWFVDQNKSIIQVRDGIR